MLDWEFREDFLREMRLHMGLTETGAKAWENQSTWFI